jgi:glutathione synthase/RimK-type ligase-like ATP-grasp enzyme
VRPCAFLTTDDLAGFVTDDELAWEPLRELGWAVTAVPWRSRSVEWSRFDAVVIRTAWDYHLDPDAFLRALERIDGSGTRLANPLPLVRWNARKTYLRDLSSRGLPVVPTVWGKDLEIGDFQRLFAELGADEIVIKPVIGATAYDTFRVGRHQGTDMAAEVAAVFAGREYMAQPFIASIVGEGEISLFYFGGKYSHAVRKTPKPEDFRVQEEHGGLIVPADPPAVLIALGHRCLAALDHPTLYARVDLVRLPAGEHALMELELIEPSLYFRMDPGAPRRFARALDAWMEGELRW